MRIINSHKMAQPFVPQVGARAMIRENPHGTTSLKNKIKL